VAADDHADALALAQPEARRDRQRAIVLGVDEADDLIEAEVREAVVHRDARGLGRVALPPGVAAQAPARLDRREDRGEVERDAQTGEAEQAVVVVAAQTPQAEAVRLPVGGEALGLGERLGVAGGAQVAHDLRVGVDGGERLAVIAREGRHPQPLGAQLPGEGHGRPDSQRGPPGARAALLAGIGAASAASAGGRPRRW
jgi:hypothetical protein